MWRFLSVVIFFVSCGMGGRFVVVVVWVVGFVVTLVVWWPVVLRIVELRKRETGREMEKKLNKK